MGLIKRRPFGLVISAWFLFIGKAAMSESRLRERWQRDSRCSVFQFIEF